MIQINRNCEARCAFLFAQEHKRHTCHGAPGMETLLIAKKECIPKDCNRNGKQLFCSLFSVLFCPVKTHQPLLYNYVLSGLTQLGLRGFSTLQKKSPYFTVLLLQLIEYSNDIKVCSASGSTIKNKRCKNMVQNHLQALKVSFQQHEVVHLGILPLP